MDLTDTYINMCRAEEIQKLWRPEIGDFYYNDMYRTNDVLDEIGKKSLLEYEKYGKTELPNFVCWLPRLDQLTDMTKYNDADSYIGFKTLLHILIDFMNDEVVKQTSSPEIILLAFIMQTQYGKEWDGKEWVSEA